MTRIRSYVGERCHSGILLRCMIAKFKRTGKYDQCQGCGKKLSSSIVQAYCCRGTGLWFPIMLSYWLQVACCFILLSVTCQPYNQTSQQIKLLSGVYIQEDEIWKRLLVWGTCLRLAFNHVEICQSNWNWSLLIEQVRFLSGILLKFLTG